MYITQQGSPDWRTKLLFLPVGYQIRRPQKQDWCDKLLSELAKLDLKVVLIRNLILVVKSEGPLSWTKTLLSLSDYDTEQLVQYCKLADSYMYNVHGQQLLFLSHPHPSLANEEKSDGVRGGVGRGGDTSTQMLSSCLSFTKDEEI